MMAWKDILIVADATEHGLARVKLALDLARAHDAHLEANVVTRLPQPPYEPFAGALERTYQGLRSAARTEGVDALAAIGALAPFNDAFSGYLCEARFDQVRRAVAAAARSADLVILGQPEAHDRSDRDAEVLMGALFDGGAPCLMVPRWVRPHAYGDRAVIAWKATPEAARAVHAALPLLKKAKRARLVLIDPRADEPGEQRRALMRLATHLSRHGVPLEEPVVATSSLDQVSQALAGQVEEFAADLLVMGAYGHSRVGELVFGGVSRDMIRDTRIPILLSH